MLVARNYIEVRVLGKIGKGPFSLASRNGDKEVVEPLLGHTD